MTTLMAPRCSDATIPPFVPHPWVRGGHTQTIVGRYLPGPRTRFPSTSHVIEVDQGDRLCLLDSTPEGWTPGDPGAVLIHGLGGCARAPYVVRVASRLLRLGIRVVRMNLRGAGAGFGLARGIYHAGRTEDVRWVAEWLASAAPGSPLAVVGFSLGANLALKLAAESADRPVEGLDSVLAANPPIDLAACSQHIQRPENRIYDRNFVRLLRAEVARLEAHFPDLEPINLTPVKTLLDFDELYTAPRNGFANATDYYAQSSSGPLIPRIQIPGLVIHAEDDPFIPPDPFRHIVFPATLALELNQSGGHLGYFSRTRWGGNRRWLDARLAAWLAARWGRPNPPG
ncbi:putative hydrolase of the alpha/beta-hydrolase fold protein [Singulisphaera acidiphila DSM 18658]|uniref:Putative hydrolase of the alpha/beta-hydrolase fold protein n=1 Tax=Singulisphaera acidiphila (strain ATCC BAA-1392 / DSM 18658 / VKM B-2454 / MOB10) TaxID=886293 RepID=L0DEB8_SINAD|nr:putative hydrolase of the alpha/beta-hydrolase fold protein [Singulisphaera acidiphila DSM 18658]